MPRCMTDMGTILFYLFSVAVSDAVSFSTHLPVLNERKGNFVGDKCSTTQECTFERSICDEKTKTCACQEEYTVTNHLDMCGKAARINDSCLFDEQCEATVEETKCQDKVCVCIFEKQPVIYADGSIACVQIPNPEPELPSVDPTMIIILVVMILMFITICIVLRLFSRARWRENRTIFNTPNPRLMNASLLGESKLGHSDRRGSRPKTPSHHSSMASLRTHSPIHHESPPGSTSSTKTPMSPK